jgi:hypothetical protein
VIIVELLGSMGELLAIVELGSLRELAIVEMLCSRVEVFKKW